MRHNVKKGLKLGTDASHTKAMKKSLAKALFENDRIQVVALADRADVAGVLFLCPRGDAAGQSQPRLPA